jgi:hypothetical protein
MVATVLVLVPVTFLLVVEAVGVHLPLVDQEWGVWEAAAVMAPPSQSQAPPPHTLGEVGVQGPLPQAQGVQGEGAEEVPFLQMPPLVYPALVEVVVVGRGQEQQGALAL